MFIYEHRFERLKYKFRKNFVNRAKNKIYFRPTSFFDEKDKFSFFTFKIAKNNIKIDRCTKNTTPDIIKAFKFKKSMINRCSWGCINQIIKIFSHKTLFKLKIRLLKLHYVQLLNKISDTCKTPKTLATKCNKHIKRRKNIRVQRVKYSKFTHFPHKMDKVQNNFRHNWEFYVVKQIFNKEEGHATKYTALSGPLVEQYSC
jgi:hypothetical protein